LFQRSRRSTEPRTSWPEGLAEFETSFWGQRYPAIDRRAQDPPVGVVESDLLAHDRHTIAMIGSPASRGAVASVVGAGRDCLAAASAVGAASAAIAASVTMTGTPDATVR
jgi:hypothetical protein